MKKIVDYRIVECYKVMENIEDGYILYGNPFAYVYTNTSYGSPITESKKFQAIIKEEESDS